MPEIGPKSFGAFEKRTPEDRKSISFIQGFSFINLVPYEFSALNNKNTGHPFFHIASAVDNLRHHERRRPKEYIARDNGNVSGNQHHHYVSSPRAASFAPEYYQTIATNPGSNPLGRSRDSYVQGSRKSATKPALVAWNAGNKARHNVKNVSAMTSEKRVPVSDKLEGNSLCQLTNIYKCPLY